MPTTDPLTGTSIPLSSDAPDGPGQIGAAVRGLSDNTIPRFTSTGTRDTAYASWVANGGAMANGLHCMVGVTRYVYESGAWKVDPTGYQVRGFRAQRNVDTSGFTSGEWNPHSSDTDWTATDPWGMRGSGATLVAPWTGIYHINVSVRFSTNSSGDRAIRLMAGASTNLGEGAAQSVMLGACRASAGIETALTGAHMTQMTAGNSARLESYQSSGTNLTILAVRMSGFYLGPNT